MKKLKQNHKPRPMHAAAGAAVAAAAAPAAAAAAAAHEVASHAFLDASALHCCCIGCILLVTCAPPELGGPGRRERTLARDHVPSKWNTVNVDIPHGFHVTLP